MSEQDYFDYKAAWLELREFISERSILLRPMPHVFSAPKSERYQIEEFGKTRKRVLDIEAKYFERARQEARTREIVAEMMKGSSE